MEIAFTKSDKLFTKSLSVLKVYWGGVIAYSRLKNSMNKVDDGHSPVDNKLTRHSLHSHYTVHKSFGGTL